MVYGNTGTGKTVTSLHFPKPIVIDLERGTDFYARYFEFDQLQTVDLDEVMEAVDELLKDPRGYKTLIIDPLTKVYNLMQEKYLNYMRVKRNDTNYELTPKDRGVIKKQVETFINKLLALDMNIVCTCREKIDYAFNPGSGEFMTAVGFSPEGPKDAAYMFDVVLRLYKNDEDKNFAKVIKDRTNRILEKEFEFSYQQLVEYFGMEDLEREPVAFLGQKHMEEQAGRRVEINWNNTKLMTAGITAKQLTQINNITQAESIDKNQLRAKLLEDYSVESLLDLKTDEATLLISDLLNKKPIDD